MNVPGVLITPRQPSVASGMFHRAPALFREQADWGASNGKAGGVPSYGEAEAEEEGSKSMVLTTHTIMKVQLYTSATPINTTLLPKHVLRVIPTMDRVRALPLAIERGPLNRVRFYSL